MTTFINRSNDIKDFPFQDYVSANETEVEELATKHNLRVYNTWMLPQIVSFFGSFEPTYNDEGFIDPRAFAMKNIGKDAWKVGMWKVVHKLRRSSLVKSQSQPAYANYSTLVPLVMSGLKKYQEIPYGKWSQVGLEYIMEPALFEAAMAPVDPDMQPEDIYTARRQGLTIKSGPKTGDMLNPVTTWRLQGIKDTALGHLPVLTQTMLAQIWVAHPSLRSRYMILDPGNWDEMPDALIEADLISQPKMFHESNYPTAPNTIKNVYDLPWM